MDNYAGSQMNNLIEHKDIEQTIRNYLIENHSDDWEGKLNYIINNKDGMESLNDLVACYMVGVKEFNEFIEIMIEGYNRA